MAAHLLWKKRGTFILAAAASAIGLGNIWRFPYELGQNGGSAFLFIYLLCIAIICVPVMLAETVIGRVGRSGPVQSFTDIAHRQRTSSKWMLIGLMGIAAGFMIAGFYAVVGGWATAYALESLRFEPMADLTASSEFFATLTSSAAQELSMMSLFLLASGGIVFMGVIAGLERFLRAIMPFLLLLLLIIVVYSLIFGDAATALAYIFKPDFTKISAETFLKAMGHAFFSLSLGMGVLITFGSYTPSEQSITRSILWVAALDTSVAVIAGVAIFPLVFAIGMDPTAGPGLVFEALPYVFSLMPIGQLMQLLFFLLLTLAALSSMVSIIEPVVSATEHRLGLLRRPACAIIVGLVWLVALGCAFSSELFGALDFISANVMLPLGGLLIAVYVGWKLSPELYQSEAGIPARAAYRGWIFILRWLAPLAIGAVLINGLYEPVIALFAS